MKSTLLTAAFFMLSSLNYAECSLNCLNCRLEDFTATFLISYSYCLSSDTCLEDEWLYIDQPCTGTPSWTRGIYTSLDACTPTLTTCHSFTSTSAAGGSWFNFTETLGANEYCVITVDSTNFPAGVVVDDATTVGAQYLANPTDTANTTMTIGNMYYFS